MALATEAGAGVEVSPPNESTLGWRGWSLVVFLSLAVCSFNLGGARALTDHEILVAAPAKQMTIDGDWLFPKIGRHVWLEKPPLMHWLAAISGKLFGFSEAAVRLPSVFAGVGIVLFMTSLSLRWFGRRVAIATGLVQTTAVYFLTYARLAEGEMLLAFIIVAALYVFVRLQRIGAVWPDPSPHLATLFWGLAGLSNLAKGPGFGVILILVPCAGFLFWQRRPGSWRRMISWPGFILAIALGVTWQSTVAWHVPEAMMIWRGMTVERAWTGGGFGQPWWYYLGTVGWQLLPWTPALLFAARGSLTRARREPESPDRFLWCWAVLPIALLSLSRGKHHHYIISCLCAFSPLIALGLLRCGTRLTFACVGLAIAGSLYVHARILPAHDPSHYDRDFLRSVRSFVPHGIPLAAMSGQEIARHMFYVDPPPESVWTPADLVAQFGHVPVFYIITRRREESRLTKIGQVQVVSQSQRTRKEQSPDDRFTLFRIQSRELISPPDSL
jgi:4-amino-4-deoxy-L-arabinose transferase-like glycosyltransferase